MAAARRTSNEEAGSARLDVARFTLLRLNNLFLERSGRR